MGLTWLRFRWMRRTPRSKSTWPGGKTRSQLRFSRFWIQCGGCSGIPSTRKLPRLRRMRNSACRTCNTPRAMSKTAKWILFLLFVPTLCWAQELAKDRVIGQLEVVATFDGGMPTGVTVANGGRIFVNFPRWGDSVEYTVGEVKGGKTVPYPSAEINRYSEADNPSEKLVSVQSVVVDPTGK